MSGSTLLHVSQLTPRVTAQGVVVLAYDPVADTFAAVQPSALLGQQGPQGVQGPVGLQGPQGVPGTAGTNGRTVLSGIGAPSGALGAAGDFYIDTQAWRIYGAKTSSGWGSGASLVGPTGPQGPAGSGGGGSGTIANGTADGQIAVWNLSAGQWQPAAGVAITADRTPTVAINAAAALTFAAHNRRRLALTASAALTLTASEIGAGMEFSVSNLHTAANQIVFGSGITVVQPATGTGTGGTVKLAARGRVAVEVFPAGSAVYAVAGGDVA